MGTISLTDGRETRVDDDIAVRYGHLRWHCHNGYVCASIQAVKKNWTALHRLIMGAIAGVLVDHINGDTLDNRRANLRLCNKSQNAANGFAPVRSASGYKGVNAIKRRGKIRPGAFRAFIETGMKYLHLGIFRTPEEAAIAYDIAAIYYHGDFARINGVSLVSHLVAGHADEKRCQ